MNTERKQHLVKVEFLEVEAGWIEFKISADQEDFQDVFSAVYDPLPDLKHWLEAIAIDVQQTSFHYFNEYDEVRMNFDYIENTARFTISDLNGFERVDLQVYVDRKQLVKSFYLEFLNFVSSKLFISTEWEVAYVEERLCQALNCDEEQLVKQLLEVDRQELKTLLFNADPTYEVSFTEAKEIEERIKLFVENALDEEEESKDSTMIETPVEWEIPEMYDFWNLAKKQAFIEKCLSEPVSGYGGAKVNDFRSKIIENYLDED